MESNLCSPEDGRPRLLPFSKLSEPTAVFPSDLEKQCRNGEQRINSLQEFLGNLVNFAADLQNVTATKIGEFNIPAAVQPLIFKRSGVCTRGTYSAIDQNWKENWMAEIKKRMRRSHTSAASIRSSNEVTVGAYVISIRSIADRREGFFLSTLLAKHYAGFSSNEVWNSPVVRALINYHWKTWARAFLIVQFALFAIWTSLVVSYVILYIESSISDAMHEDDSSSPLTVASYVLNFVAFVIMWPFALKAALTLWQQRLQWVQLRNLIGATSIILQTLFFICQWFKCGVGEPWYNVFLAVHGLLMFEQLQDYWRVFGIGTAFMDTFFFVLYEIRYFVVSIGIGAFCCALCLATLYKGDTKFEVDHKHEDFMTINKSIVSTLAILFGQFEVDYIFHASYPWVKSFFFFGLQMFMTVAIMNMLIAAMTQPYSIEAQYQHIRYNVARAYIIDELELIGIPQYARCKIHPFVHFLVLEPARKESNLYDAPFSSETEHDVQQFHQEVSDLKHRIQSLKSLVESGQYEFD